MLRDLDAILAAHRQRYSTSERSSLLELQLKFLGISAPDLQSREAEAPAEWTTWVDQVYGHAAVRRYDWSGASFGDFLREEISAGRPVALMIAQPLTGSGRRGERGWLAVRWNQIGPFLFADLRGKLPDAGGGEGQFSEKKVLRVDHLTAADVGAVISLEELFPRPPSRMVRPPRKI